jgi:hypothetical protein
MRYYISSPPMNPVSRVIAALMAVAVMVAAFFFGLAILAVLVVVFSLFAVTFWVRSWWLRRGVVDENVARTTAAPDGNEIEAEYTVVSRRRS